MCRGEDDSQGAGRTCNSSCRLGVCCSDAPMALLASSPRLFLFKLRGREDTRARAVSTASTLAPKHSSCQGESYMQPVPAPTEPAIRQSDRRSRHSPRPSSPGRPALADRLPPSPSISHPVDAPALHPERRIGGPECVGGEDEPRAWGALTTVRAGWACVLRPQQRRAIACLLLGGSRLSATRRRDSLEHKSILSRLPETEFSPGMLSTI